VSIVPFNGTRSVVELADPGYFTENVMAISAAHIVSAQAQRV
jgi:hypothetical protein